ncbi:MAG TPA: hypothetical protein VEC37_07585 [Bacillota bacterium]|nr:hypothetical protein [Bacillota bacterium]
MKQLEFENEVQKLDLYYEKLLRITGDPETEPDQVIELSDQASMTITNLAKLLQNQRQADIRPRLEQLYQKLLQVMRLVENEKNKAYQALIDLKTGKRAVKSYGPPPVGMGYTEGKFLDQKK